MTDPGSTNILNLPALSGDGTVFEVTTNSDWTDALFFPGFGTPDASTLIGSMVEGSNQITVSSTSGLAVGQPIGSGPGIPDGAFIDSIISPTEIGMADESGFVLYATSTNTNIGVTFLPIGMDLTGIDFVANIRADPTRRESFLTIQTTDGSFINGGKSGALAFNIPESVMQRVPAATYVMDIVAIADGMYVNLFPLGPATVIVLGGVTDPATLTVSS